MEGGLDSSGCIPALGQPGCCGGIHCGTEGIHIVEACFPDGSLVITKERQHQGFLGLQDLQTEKGNPANTQSYDSHNQQGDINPAALVNAHTGKNS